MLRFLKSPAVLIGVALVVVLAVTMLRPTPIGVDTAVVERGTLQVTVDEEGETRVRERYVVSAPVTGELVRIELEPGDRVARGAVVASIRPGPATLLDARERAEAEARVQAAEAAAGRARAELQRAAAAAEFADSQAKRARELSEAKLLPQQDLEAQESRARIAQQELSAAEFALRAAQEDVRLARARLTPTTPPTGRAIEVKSPVGGLVLKRLRESEAVVAVGEPLIEIGNPDNLEIVSDLLSTDAVRVRPGDRVEVVEWGGGEPFEGTVRRVEPSGFTKISALGVEEQRVNVLIDFAETGEAVRALGDAYRVEVRIVVNERRNTIKAPSSSLFRAGEGFAVFVVEGDRASRRPVEVGARTGLEVEILSGLAEGERVVVHPPDTLTDGALVGER
jgi:HlyD family secretion protein